MKPYRIILLLACALVFAACSDSGIDDGGSGTGGKTEEKAKRIAFSSDYIQVAAAGGQIDLVITTNLDEDDFEVTYYSGNGMIEPQNHGGTQNHGGRAATRAVSQAESYAVSATVLPNTDAHSRVTEFIAASTSDESVADTIFVIQDGTALTTSTDFTKDKQVELLQPHTRGGGIPVILMGEAFGDTEVGDGTYRKTMLKAMENMFSEQPLEALRGWFDVYMVYAVSAQNDVGQCYNTCFSAVMPADGTSEVDGDDEAVAEEYGFSDDDSNRMLLVVVLNNNNYAGTTYMYTDNRGVLIDYAVCYCPVIDGLDAELFRAVLTHEAVGHGFAKLADEYSYEENGAIPSDESQDLRSRQQSGWFQNVSLASGDTPWAGFTADADYGGEPELIGSYEGGYGYWRNVWRPSEESIMNSNTNHFNAPCRKLIYDKVREHNGEGASEFAAFKAFDLENYPDFSAAEAASCVSRSASDGQARRFARPLCRIKR